MTTGTPPKKSTREAVEDAIDASKEEGRKWDGSFLRTYKPSRRARERVKRDSRGVNDPRAMEYVL